MLNLFLPNKHVDTVYDITPTFLKENGKKAVIVDLDNTLVPWNVSNATEEIKTWLYSMEEANIKVTIFSNNNEERVRIFSEPLHIPFIHKANKPLKTKFRRAQKLMGVKKDEVVVIGDQLLTDILGGNRAGFYTILVVPIVQSDAAITKFNRRMERKILNRFYAQGKLTKRVLHDE